MINGLALRNPLLLTMSMFVLTCGQGGGIGKLPVVPAASVEEAERG
jgi:hypothetical protein